ncbi:hypothetical protein WISP_138926 [Willisornis vidua]|uniref:Uncharacterized protein n=1 Tax=Willisornis vidua TaxID=1566151 RepID=A0ABQ9CSB9_9PASS|nr:hypothetical protein WISP_138926 [Willisornis vidua]
MAPCKLTGKKRHVQLTASGEPERGQPCNTCGDQCPGFALHKWRLMEIVMDFQLHIAVLELMADCKWCDTETVPAWSVIMRFCAVALGAEQICPGFSQFHYIYSTIPSLARSAQTMPTAGWSYSLSLLT